MGTSPATAQELLPIRSESVVQLAYERIRALIVEGELADGTRLQQVELAERLAVSRTPVREALRRLAGEGLVEFADHRGYRVASVSIAEVVDRLGVRAELEPAIARLAARHRTDADLEALAASVARQRRARTSLAVHDASRAFHAALAAATGNPAFVTTLDGLWRPEVGRRLLARRRTALAWQSEDADEHEGILDAVRDRDAELAARLMDSHVRAALRHWEA